MPLPASTPEAFAQRYATAIEALCDIAGSYFALGRVRDARRLLSISLDLVEAVETEPHDRLKLLLLYSRVLVVDNLLARADADLLIATAQKARKLAETIHDQQGIADALSLLGQAHYFSTVGAALQRGTSVDGRQGTYDKAIDYQQQALAFREALHDSQGVCESLFFIGNVYERWQQPDQAQNQYMQARQIAEQCGNLFIQAELARHRALAAFFRGEEDQALADALQAVSFREAVPFRPFLPIDHFLLRDIYQAMGDTANATLHAEIATTLAEEMGYSTYVSSAPRMGDIRAARQKGTQE